MFEYGDGNLRLDIGGIQWKVPPSQKALVQQRFVAQFPPFKRATARPMGWMPGAWAIGGLGINHFDNGIGNVWQFGIPFWLPASLFLILPARFFLRRWLAADRRRRGMCPYCGYDLRATAGVCPECGQVPGSQVLAAECGPAIAATARSTGTIGVVVLAIYFAAAIYLVVQGFSNWQAPMSARGLIIAAAMVLILAGAFHAAGYSRSGEALFGYGALAGLLLFPLYLELARYTSPKVQVTISLMCLIVMGLLARTCGMLRWRLQDRAPARTGDQQPAKSDAIHSAS